MHSKALDISVSQARFQYHLLVQPQGELMRLVADFRVEFTEMPE
jgi:hypothetical protein